MCSLILAGKMQKPSFGRCYCGRSKTWPPYLISQSWLRLILQSKRPKPEVASLKDTLFEATLAISIAVLDFVSALRLGYPDPLAPGYAKEYRSFDNCCLVDSLRSLGCKVAYPGEGPWRVRDGSSWLRSLGSLASLRTLFWLVL